LALFIGDVVDHLDLSSIRAVYEAGDGRGQPPYHPGMIVKLLMYAYCTGKPSSRKIEKATWEDVAYRVLSCDQHPDHDSIAAFRERHLKALGGMFLQVLRLCQKAGLVKLGHVALDGTKVKANASKHKAMSYERMGETEKRLEEEVARLLAEAQAVDKAEDEQYGKGKRGDELPEELRRRASRLVKIREAKAALEEEAKARAEVQALEAHEKIEERQRQEAETGRKPGGHGPKVPDPQAARPEPKAQRNFTDPESRIMKDGTGFEQAYNAQAVVDAETQVIVAASVTQETNDKRQLVPMLKEAIENVGKPERASADAGYFSAEAVTDEAVSGIELYVPPDRQKHGETSTSEGSPPAEGLSVADQMRQALRTEKGKDTYRMRKAIVEPVFGQIKEARGFRRFSFRGLAKVSAEWDLVCLTHNLLKLFRSGWSPELVGTG
jgi:transposase